MIGVLNCFDNCLNIRTRCHVFNAFIQPKLNYCLPVWCHNNKSTEYAIDHILLRAAHIILHDKTAKFNNDNYSFTAILPFKLLFSLSCLSTVYSLLWGDDKHSFLLPVFTSDSSSQRTTRNRQHKFILLLHKTSAVENCFYHSAARQWNDLPNDLNAILDQNQFFKCISSYILAQLS